MLNVGIVFGGVSPEHEVSIITAMQVAAALDKKRYRPIPVYLAKDGNSYTGPNLFNIDVYKDVETLLLIAQQVHLQSGEKGNAELVANVPKGWFGQQLQRISLDVMFIALHGGEGENGSFQGICELYDVPYTGSGVLGSAVGMDKVFSKMLCRDQDIPVVPFMPLREFQWADKEEACMDACEAQLGYPVIVKPARLGSSIGISKASNRAELDAAIEEAFRYDEKIVIEHAIQNLREINCSILGDADEAIASVLEQPLTGEELLTYQEKYMRGNSGDGAKTAGAKGGGTGGSSSGMASLDRVIPAPLSDEHTTAIQTLAVRIFQLFECAGLARIDFMIDESTGQVYFNEINTIPGSFSFYLWQPSGVPFDELTHRLIEIARAQNKKKRQRVRSYNVNLLAMHGSGAKGVKA
ncbi:MAG: D-alanine--D-alanine ligase family protein [Rhodothermales bacterium]